MTEYWGHIKKKTLLIILRIKSKCGDYTVVSTAAVPSEFVKLFFSIGFSNKEGRRFSFST